MERTDRMFALLMAAQWIGAVAFTWLFSPYTWEGRGRTLHSHLYGALVLGGVITCLPVALS